LRLFSLRHGTIGLPHFIVDMDSDEAGYPPYQAMLPVLPLPGMHRYAMVPAGSSTPLQWGFPTLGSTGTVTARARWNTGTDQDYHYYYPARVQAVTGLTANTAASLRWATVGQGMVGGRYFNSAYKGGLYVARFRPIIEEDDRVFIGLMDRTTDPTATLNPSATAFADNMVGIGKDSGDSNYYFMARGSAGPTLKALIDAPLGWMGGLNHLFIMFGGDEVRIHLAQLGTSSDSHSSFSYHITDLTYVPNYDASDELFPWFYVNNGPGANVTLSARVEYFGHSITDFAATSTGDKPPIGVLQIDSVTYTGKSFSVAAQDTSPRGIRFSSDGLRMYVLGAVNKKVFQYNLSVPWDVTTAVYEGQFLDVSAQVGASPSGLSIDRWGDYLFVGSQSNAAVYRYELATKWEVSTGAYSGNTMSTAAQDASPSCFDLLQGNNNRGTRLWVHGNATGALYQYNLTSPWQLTGASYSGKTKSTAARDSSITAMCAAASPVNPNGAFLIGQTNDTISDTRDNFYVPGELDLQDGTDTSNALTAQDTLPVGICVDFFDQDHLYMLGDATDTVYQYSVP
jgi:hypothetical protein